jgi:hypothetical protein
VEGETEPVTSSHQQDGELKGELSHLIVWQVTMQDLGLSILQEWFSC